ncbi:GNAT family N-acetyltransferase [Micromonospora endolithica]|uniref:N-acetyltransferase n=1 Tax=Micromonospora endolithica TaxID=230091 RepID=A0A3A9ZMM3_9ACTN|nr:GNAT family N-acetyltransferase [Micromonospora endolithica]RKN49538.1 N-acetyltransferase [Micromonospora endolithica]TWJ23753.1 RimJ/RimL family protein N-acetyltransferase [Micromonospora endolithica]
MLEDTVVALRPWTEDDLPQMVRLFHDPEIAFRTPVAAPFDAQAARAHLEMVRRARKAGDRLCLAITAAEDDVPRGEIMVNLRDDSIGYAVGPAYRGHGLAARAVRLLTAYAHEVLARPRLHLWIEADNAASTGVARSAGYRPGDAEAMVVEDKGRRYALLPWVHDRPGGPA